jgi:transcriptional regulator with XRE-family HTH domain
MSVHLKLLRLQKQMTLDQLAQAVGVTRSYLSKVERGVASPSIGVSTRLAEALGVTVERLFHSDAGEQTLSITRAADHRHQFAGLVSSAIARSRMSAFVLRPDKSRRRNPSSRHGGEELVYVLNGSVELQLADRKERLQTGDCAHFDSTVPHKITSLGETQAQLLVVIAPFATDDGKDPA